MKPLLRMAASVGLVSCLFSSPVQAQASSEQGIVHGTIYDEHLGIERPYTRLRGDALPTYLVVEAFFYSASLSLDRPPEVWNGFLKQIEIPPGSRAESGLRDAVLAARESVLVPLASTPTSAQTENPPPSSQEQLQRTRDQVHSLATIYASLLLDLAASGYQIGRLQDHLEYQTRPGISLTVYPDPTSPVDLDARILAEKLKFDDLLTEALAAEGARRGRLGG